MDNSFLNGLKNKMEVLRLGDEASKQVNSKHLMAERGSSFVNALRGATNKEEEEEQKNEISQNGTFSKIEKIMNFTNSNCVHYNRL